MPSEIFGSPTIPRASHDTDDDILLLADEPDESDGLPELIWRVLVVDDDEQVHAITRFALADLVVMSRRVELYHARSAADVQQLLAERRDFAVIMLDVVMEHEQTGLEIVRHIRHELGMVDVRIILRTGQPGYAPDIEVMQQYDINDYRTKTELTRNRLVTSLIGAIRTYAQIVRIGRNRRGLEQIVHSSADLLNRRGIESFSAGVLEQIAALVDVPAEGIVCVQRVPGGSSARGALTVVGAAGRYATYVNAPLDQIPAPHIVTAIARCIERCDHVIGEDSATLYLRTGDREGAVYLANPRLLSDLDQQLIAVFASNIATSFENVVLFERLHDLAYLDALSGLPNRARFLETLASWSQAQQPWQVALIDIDHFSDLNTAMGYDLSNQLLRAIAARLERTIGRSCVIARVDGDVFGVIGPTTALRVEELLALFEEQFVVGDHEVPLTVTIGVCRSEHASYSGLDTFRRAEMALTSAKESATAFGVQLFEPHMERAVGDRLRLIRELRSSFKGGQFDVWFQPQIDLSERRIIGFEALLRWRRSDGSMVAPNEFVPLAESSGAIVEIGHWVLEQSCTFLRELDELRLGDASVSVNVTVPQFRRVGFVGAVAQTLDLHRVDPGRIKLEITENIVMDEPRIVSLGLEQLRKLGVRLSIDDFGTGFSSLSYLQHLPLDELKVDRAFVQEIELPRGAAIARTIIMLAQQLGMTTLGEGVETLAQAQSLRQLGCRGAQGYLFARPMPRAEVVTWLAHAIQPGGGFGPSLDRLL